MSYTTKAEMRADVRTWQRILKFHGYDCGAIDGIRGKKTAAAEARWDEDAARAKAEIGVFDERTEGNLETVAPVLQGKVRTWLKKVRSAAAGMGYEVRIIEGMRTNARQNELLNSGKGVTKASGGNSWHNYALAVDFGLFRGKAYETANDKAYAEIGKVARTIPGLEWGGDFTSFKDYPHLQLKKYSKVSEAKKHYQQLS